MKINYYKQEKEIISIGKRSQGKKKEDRNKEWGDDSTMKDKSDQALEIWKCKNISILVKNNKEKRNKSQ